MRIYHYISSDCGHQIHLILLLRDFAGGFAGVISEFFVDICFINPKKNWDYDWSEFEIINLSCDQIAHKCYLWFCHIF